MTVINQIAENKKGVVQDPYAFQVVGTPRTVEEAEILVRQIEREELASKQKKELLKKFFIENPEITRVRGDMQEYAYNDTTKYTIEPHKVVDLLKLIASNGENPYQYISVSIPQLLKKEWFDENLAQQFAVQTFSKRLQPKKVSMD